MTKYLTDEEAGALVRRSARTIERWRREEGLRFLQGTPPVIDPADLLDFLEHKKARLWFKHNRHISKRTGVASSRSDGVSRNLMGVFEANDFQRGRAIFAKHRLFSKAGGRRRDD